MKKGKSKQAEIEVPLTIEQKYDRLIGLMSSMHCMRSTWEKVDMYSKIALQFAEFGEYEEASSYIEECNKLIKHTEEEIKTNHYKKAENLKKIAKSAKDYRIAAEEYQQASGYLDADKHAKECENLSNKIENNRIKNGLIKRGVYLLAIVALIFISFLPITRYTAANGLLVVNRGNSLAIKIYTKLGDYKDSNERIKQSYYKMGIKLEDEKRYSEAQNAYIHAEGYKDGNQKEISMIKLAINNSEIGKTIKFGPYNWIILSKTDSAAQLIKKVGIQGIPYNEADKDITWEKSSLRSYLNTEFLKQTFTDNEQKSILQTNVINDTKTMFGTEGGNNTLDYVYLLSNEEALQYVDIIDIFKNNNWLRSPGNTQNSAAFLMAKGIVMDYGYMVTNNQIASHPVIWFNLK